MAQYNKEKYYWIKLKQSLMTSKAVDFLMSQKDGANYVVLYQCLCLKTVNQDGELADRIGEIIIPFDEYKIQRETKWFSIDTIRVAMTLYKKLGLIYEQEDGILKITDFEDLVGSQTISAYKKELQLKGRVEKGVESFPPRDRYIDNKSIDIDNKREEKEKIKKEKFTAPTYEDVLEYAKSRNREDLARKFYDYFTAGNWVDSKGNKVKNWKQKFITWEQHNTTTSTIPQQPTNIREWWTTENEKHKWIGQWWIDGKTDEELIKRKKRFDEGGINNALYDFSKL